jgi:hypothetical protein
MASPAPRVILAVRAAPVVRQRVTRSRSTAATVVLVPLAPQAETVVPAVPVAPQQPPVSVALPPAVQAHRAATVDSVPLTAVRAAQAARGQAPAE